MELVPTIGGIRRSLANRASERGSTTLHERLIELSSWLLVIGTIRVVCGFADYATAFIDMFWRAPFSIDLMRQFIETNSPIIAICVFWPLVVGIGLRRTRWPQLLLAASVTLLILSLGGVLELISQAIYAPGDGLNIGSFHMTRRAFLTPRLSDFALMVMGTIQLLIEFATALRALILVRQFGIMRGSTSEPGKSDFPRRALIGRLSVYVSFGFMLLLIRLPVWSTYLRLLQDSRLVREFVISNDLQRINSPPRVYKLTKEEEQLRAFQTMMAAGYAFSQQGRFLDAKDAYIRIIDKLDSAPTQPMRRGYSSLIAEANNNLAWMLATCTNTELRDPQEALRLARRAVEVEPQQGNFWNTLGVAYYRAGELEQGRKALLRSLELRNEGDSFDWFFLALIDLKSGKDEQAREWYDKAVAWYQTYRPGDPELFHFHAEAAAALGLSKPMHTPAKSVQQGFLPRKTVGEAPPFNPSQSRPRRGFIRPNASPN